MVTNCSPWSARVVFSLLSLTLFVGMSVPSRGAGITAQDCQEAAARSNSPPPGCHGRRVLETTIIKTQQGQPVCRMEKVEYTCPKPYTHVSLSHQIEYFLLGDVYSSADTPPDPLWTFLTTNPYDNGLNDVLVGFLEGLFHVDKPPQMRNNSNYNRGYLVGAIGNVGSNFVRVRATPRGRPQKAQLINESTRDRYVVYDSTNPRFQAFATVEDGDILITMRTQLEAGVRSTVLKGAEQFRQILDHFTGRFTGIRGSWSYGDNLTAFNEAMGRGLSPQEAALATWTGGQAAAAGYTRVIVRSLEGSPGMYNKVSVTFARP